ncbi:WD repeat-containing protein 49-like [Latimeria chalumnae]|uniref:WD repeat-containing protein 49-like n=1 Tax=Latimeria chalumnae TaxID=7897 RepID=UPI00313DD3E4
MTLAEFRTALTDMLGSEQWNSQMQLLFNKVDTSCDGLVDWSEFCTYMLLQYKERDYQEATARILAVPSPPPLRFMSVSRGGVLTVWDNDLRMQKSYKISTEANDLHAGKRRFKSWTTDAVYMPNVHKVAIATTSRDIHFFDVSTASCFEELHLYALNNVPNCLCYWYDEKSPGSRSLLLWGDDTGDVNLLWFLRPHIGMFEKPFTEEDGPQQVFMQEIGEHSRLLSYQVVPEVQKEAITKIMYEPEGDFLITSSANPMRSVVIMDIHRKKKVYTWKIRKGVTCFDFNKSLNLLVTGGVDHTVRLWNQYVTSRPTALLHGHCLTVLDVAINEPLGQIFSYSKDSVLKVWDILSYNCLRTLVLKFPCIQPGRILEHGEFPFLLVQQHPHVLLVSCADYIAMLKLEHADHEGEILLTHSAQLCSAIYNPFFHQVVTGCDDSSVAVWDVETGTKCLQLTNVHGTEEITCMAFDSSLRRLITGARNGTIKVWNLQNGHNLHRLEVVMEAEVTGVLPFQDQKFLVVGWSHKIALYDDSQPGNLYLAADLSWKGGQIHKDDILAVDYCPSFRLLATGGFDGEIIVWNTETQRVYFYLRKSHHKRLQPPVDKLLFLQYRAADVRLKESGMLISSEAGTLYWWSIFGAQQQCGQFYAPRKANESILGVSTNQTNSVLVSGDTAGFIQVWDISEYGLHLNEKPLKKPPLLHSWRAHDSTVVSTEHFLFDSSSFIVSASSDKTARLWTAEGKYVGTFGQEKKWNLKNPLTYLHPKDPWGQINEITKKKRIQTKQQAFINSFLSNEGTFGECLEMEKDVETSQGEKERETIKIYKKEEEKQKEDLSMELQRTLSPSPLDQALAPGKEIHSFAGNIHPRKSRSHLGQYVEGDLLRKVAARQERRCVFGDININKVSRFGQICSPFQALATPEVQEVCLPQDLPMSPWMLSEGISCTTESDLRKLRLTNVDMEDDIVEEPKMTPKKRASVQMKTPLLPLIVPSASLSRTMPTDL